MDALTHSRSCEGYVPLALRFLLFSIVLLAGLCPAAGYAAVQGSTGPDTTGSVDLTYVQGLNVRINGLSDMPLGVWGGSGALAANDNICIGRTGVPLFSSAGTYRILASGDGEPGDPAAFTLSNGPSQMYYRAFFNDQTGTAGRQELTAGVALTNQNSFGLFYFFNMIFTCGAENANISIEVPEAQLSGAGGVYTGTLSLMLIPE
jgi:hypothetical protein